jgi:ADP-ribosyl-[dinitrogen reductase] hydrolase
MTSVDGYRGALEAAVRAATTARGLLLAECARPSGPRGVDGHCEADVEAERVIRRILLDACPSWGYRGEELGHAPPAVGESHYWVVDPNDGTSAMQRGYRGHAVSIAVVHDGAPVLGVVQAVDAPDDDGDCFAWAEGCGPIVRNGRPPQRPAWPSALGAHDVVLLSQAADRRPVGNLACVAPARYRGVASIAYRLALCAAGEGVAGVSVSGPCDWDFAAGHALLLAAGGVLVDETGRPVRYGPDAASSSGWVFGGAPGIVQQLARRPWGDVRRTEFGDATPPPDLAPVRLSADAHVHDSGVLRRAQGCLLGQLAGDALGSLVEFQDAATIAGAYPGGGPALLEDGGRWDTIAGQPTDDSELALVLARTLVARPGYDEEAVAAGYGRWFHGWTHAERAERCEHGWCRPFDYGGTTAAALGPITSQDVHRGLAAAVAKRSAAPSATPDNQANGALMRVSPLGIWGTYRTAGDVAAAARQDARLTHPSRVCQDASAVFAVAIAAAIRDGLDGRRTYDRARAWATQEGVHAAVLARLEAAATAPPADFSRASGWVLTALQNAFHRLVSAPSFEQAVIATVRAGGDTDTNAAICGALLGAVHGREAVPSQWRQMVLSCRPLAGHPGVRQPRPAMVWPTDALPLAERLVLAGRSPRRS